MRQELIAKLNALEGDTDLELEPDLEDGDDEEPDLAGFETIKRVRWLDASGTYYAEFVVDAEEDCDDEGAQCDDEGFDSDSEPDGDSEGTSCISLMHEGQVVWPPRDSTEAL